MGKGTIAMFGQSDLFPNTQTDTRKSTPPETSDPSEEHHNCGHFVLNSNSLQLIPAYSSQSSSLAQTLAAVGLSES